MEEAPVQIKVVDKQQRRWKAGYFQTGLVHTRQPLRSMRRMGPLRWLCFNLLCSAVPGRLPAQPAVHRPNCRLFHYPCSADRAAVPERRLLPQPGADAARQLRLAL